MTDQKDLARTNQMPKWTTARGAYVAANDALRFDRKAELLNEVMSSFITQLYVFDERKQPMHVDQLDYRILLYVPWSKTWKAPIESPLLKTERDVLRAIISASQKSDKTVPLFIYDQPNYFLSAMDYKTAKSALGWLQSLRIDGALYRKHDALRRQTRRQADQRKRLAA